MDTSGQSAIYTKDVATGHVTKIISSTTNMFFPTIDGTRVAWMQMNPSGIPTIYYKNLASGLLAQIVNTTQNYLPNISGTQIIWTHIDASNNTTIYLKYLLTGRIIKLTLI